MWVARRPPGYAFVDFDDKRDAQDAIRELDGIIVFYILLVYMYYTHGLGLLFLGFYL